MLLEMQFGSLDQVFLQGFAQFYEVCAVACYTDEHVFVVFRVFLGGLHASRSS